MHQAAPQPASSAGMFWSGSKSQKRSTQPSPFRLFIEVLHQNRSTQKKINQKAVWTVNIKGTGVQNEEMLNNKFLYKQITFQDFQDKSVLESIAISY